jgi:pyruvate, water dikinase
MKLWKQVSEIFRKLLSTAVPQGSKESCLKKYRLFRELLSHNNKALELMADMEERFSGEAPPDRHRLCGRIAEITGQVSSVIDKLNLISKQRYRGLYAVFNEITAEMGTCLVKDRGIKMLRTRQLPMETDAPGVSVPVFREHRILVDKGLVASRGIGFGKAFVLKTEEDLRNFPAGAVLIAKHASTTLTSAINKASAVVTDVGASTVHIATIARELQVPAIVNAETATEVIRSGQEITVDAFNGVVYEGHVEELSGFRARTRLPIEETGIRGKSAGVLSKIVPLNLVDPESELFSPEQCRTLHDIIRFAHQKAMQEMFRLSEEFPEGVEAVKLLGGIPLSIHVIDLGSGLSPDVSGSAKAVRPEQVISIPFKAFFSGLASAVWPEPRQIDAAGFMGMMAHTASIPETELERMGEKSFAFIAGEYMNFSINLGYHLSVVEAFAGENINDNYIRMFFKGGGADLGRRMRRVVLISEVLRRTDFDVRVTEDVIRAAITKDSIPSLEKKLGVLGRLTVYTKQLDAIMPDDSTVALFLEEFIEKYFPSSEAVP